LKVKLFSGVIRLILLHKCTNFAENTSLLAVLLPVYESGTKILKSKFASPHILRENVEPAAKIM